MYYIDLITNFFINIFKYIIYYYDYYLSLAYLNFPPNEFVDNNSTIIFLVITILIMHLRYTASNSRLGIILFDLPGTILHELSHYIIAFIIGCRPTGFTVIPRRVANGWMIGEVKITKGRGLHLIIVAFAPLLLIPLAFWVDYHFFYYFSYTYTNIFLYFYILINILVSAIPSTVDFKVALGGFWSIVKFILSIIIFFAVIICSVLLIEKF